jgi:NAD(P)-dependent dehydrogenase (short-subunit alcohol dehydrogenase family)
MATHLIIGGTRGIGAALAQALQTQGHDVHVMSRQPAENPLPGVTYHLGDATAGLSAAALPGTLHGLAYCPGSIQLKPFQSLTDQAFLQDLETNLMGAVRCLRGALPALKQGVATGGASVVLFSTVAVQTGMPFHASVAAAKGAVEGLSRSLAAEWARTGIRVNTIAPSISDTSLAQGLLRTDAQREAAAQRHPIARIGTATELAELAAFLLGPNSGWLTGQVLHADGGMGALRLL